MRNFHDCIIPSVARGLHDIRLAYGSEMAGFLLQFITLLLISAHKQNLLIFTKAEG